MKNIDIVFGLIQFKCDMGSYFAYIRSTLLNIYSYMLQAISFHGSLVFMTSPVSPHPQAVVDFHPASLTAITTTFRYTGAPRIISLRTRTAADSARIEWTRRGHFERGGARLQACIRVIGLFVWGWHAE